LSPVRDMVVPFIVVERTSVVPRTKMCLSGGMLGSEVRGGAKKEYAVRMSRR